MPNANAPITAPAALIPCERVTVEIVTGAMTSEFTVDMSGVGGGGALDTDADLAARMRILEPLRGWLEDSGALTPGSGVLVRTLPERVHPEEIDAERALPGTVLDRRELLTLLLTPQTPTAKGM